MNPLLRKALTDLVLLGIPPLLRILTDFDDFISGLGARIGEGAFGTELNEFLLGYSDPPAGPFYPQSFNWCWYVPLLALIGYYHVVDRSRWRGTGVWLGVVLAAALVCAVIAFAVVGRYDGVVPALEEVGFGPRFVWALLNFLFAALLGTLFSLALAPAAVNTRLTPFGR